MQREEARVLEATVPIGGLTPSCRICEGRFPLNPEAKGREGRPHSELCPRGFLTGRRGIRASSGGSAVKNPPAMQEPQKMQVLSLGQKDPLQEEMATHSCILAWESPVDNGL